MITHPHKNKCFSASLLSLWKVKVHLVPIKVSIVRCTDALVEPERAVRHDTSLEGDDEEVKKV